MIRRIISEMKRLSFFLNLFLILGLTSISGAATFDVSNLSDLQNALTAAIGNNENDTITVSAGTYNITSTLNYFPGDPENYSLRIIGAGIGKTIFDGGGTVNILNLDTRSLANDSNAHLIIEGITFLNGASGSSEPAGGLLIATNNANMTIRNSQFSNNTSQYDGGAVFARADANGNINLINNVFNGNIATISGGGAKLQVSADGIGGTAGTIHLTNNTFIGNSAGHVGGGVVMILNNMGDTGNIYNNIFWNNAGKLASDLLVSNQTGAPVNLFNNIYTEFRISVEESLTQENNLNHAPLLTSTFHLKSGSFGIDKGNNNAPLLPSVDFEGTPRIVNGIVDIGADEFGSVSSTSVMIGVYRKSTGTWYLAQRQRRVGWSWCGRRYWLGWGFERYSGRRGLERWTGRPRSGCTEKSTGTWYLDNGNGVWDGPGVDGVIGWGGDASDTPIVGDWNGAGNHEDRGTPAVDRHLVPRSEWESNVGWVRDRCLHWDGCGSQ